MKLVVGKHPADFIRSKVLEAWKQADPETGSNPRMHETLLVTYMVCLGPVRDMLVMKDRLSKPGFPILHHMLCIRAEARFSLSGVVSQDLESILHVIRRKMVFWQCAKPGRPCSARRLTKLPGRLGNDECSCQSIPEGLRFL